VKEEEEFSTSDESVIPSRVRIERENTMSRTCKHFKYVSLNVAHSPKWSNGKAPFSGAGGFPARNCGVDIL